MTLSTSSSGSSAPVFFLSVVLIAVFASAPTGAVSSPVERGGAGIAVLPFDNLSGGTAPLREMRRRLLQRMERRGIRTVPDEKIEPFLARYRIRYTGGIDSETAEKVGDELGAEAVLVTTVELYDESAVPKIALVARLIAAEKAMQILWADSAGLSGDDAPGIFNIGMIDDPRVLQEKAVRRITGSLAAYLADREARISGGVPGKPAAAAKGGRYAPRVHYRRPLPEGVRYRVAVLPFHNETDRRNAGEILMLHVVEQLVKRRGVAVVEPGAVRQQLINLRMVMSNGISLPDMDIIADFLQADMIVAGRCLQYEDAAGTDGVPKVMFSVLMIERESRKMVWSSVSYNEGDNGVLFFDFGKIHTASALASKMTRALAELMVQ